MDVYDLVLLSLRTLGKNKLRSILTVLGVVIGIAAVTTMVSVGQGAGQLVRNEFQNLGANVIVVFPGASSNGGVNQGTVATLTVEDAAALPEECPAVQASSPLVPTSGQVIGGNENWQPRQMFGVGVDYPIVRNWPLSAGEFFGDREVLGPPRCASSAPRSCRGCSPIPTRSASKYGSRTSLSP